MDFENDLFRLKEAIGQDTEIFIEVFNNFNKKYPDKQDLIIGIVEQDLAERSKNVDAFIKKATTILRLEKVSPVTSLSC